MKQSAWNRLDTVARNLSPFAVTLLLVMAGMVPLHIMDLSPIVPSLALIAIFFWAAHRPDLMPAWVVFLIGLLQDLLTSTPLGVGVVALLLVYASVTSQNRFLTNASFLLLWCIFTVVAAGAILAMWLLTSLVVGEIVDIRPAIFQYFMTVAVYPCFAWFFVQVQRTLLR